MKKKFITVLFYISVFQATVGQLMGVHLSLNGVRYANNSIILITGIGRNTTEGNNALQCVTKLRPCCKVGYSLRIGEWYFPNGKAVPIKGEGANKADTFYRDRGENDGTVNLNRVNSNVSSPIGLFCCEIPNSKNITQRACVNIAHTLDVQLNTTTMHEDGKKVVIGVSVATTLVTIVVILVSLVIVTFLVWRHLKKSRLLSKDRTPPTAIRYTLKDKDNQLQDNSRNPKHAYVTKPGAHMDCDGVPEHYVFVSGATQNAQKMSQDDFYDGISLQNEHYCSVTEDHKVHHYENTNAPRLSAI